MHFLLFFKITNKRTITASVETSSSMVIYKLIVIVLLLVILHNKKIGCSVQCFKELWQSYVPVKLTCPLSWGILDHNVLKTGSDWRERG